MDADKIKQFFIFHVEKMILVLVIAVSGFLVYSGLNKPLILSKNQPNVLAEDAKQVRASIDEDHNENVLAERNSTIDIVARTERRNQPVPAERYSLVNVLEQKSIDGSVRRSDPVLVPPRDLRMFGVAALIAKRSSTGTYEVTNLEAADAVEKVEKKVKKPTKRELRQMEMMMGGDMGGDMSGGYGMDSGMGYDSGMDMGGSMAGSMGSGRRLDAKFNFGFSPVATATGEKPVPEIMRFIAGTAVMPHKEMFEAFQLAFRDASGYLMQRDIPIYYNLQLERADVTGRSVDTLTDKDYAMVANRAMYLTYAKKYWSGFAKEIVPGEYRDNALTTYIPPILLDDYRPYTIHPLIPLEKPIPAYGAAAFAANAANTAAVDDNEPMIFATPGGGIAGGYGGGMDFSMDPMGMGNYGGYGMGTGGIGADPVDYKLIRFYDIENPSNPGSVRTGRLYVYRVRVSIMDPNFPMNPAIQPRGSTLAEDVYKRVADLTLAAEEAGGRTSAKNYDPRRGYVFERWTDWSEPSAPVSLPDKSEYFVGPITPATSKPATVGGRQVMYSRDEPSAKMVTTQFDDTYKVRVPMTINVTDGTVLSAKGTADVVDPITLEVKKLPDAEIITSTTVIDLDGGQPLEISAGEEMIQPALMLLFDNEGRLTVSDETSDQELYRIHSYADERGE